MLPTLQAPPVSEFDCGIMLEKDFLNMSKFDLRAFAEELNSKAQSYRIGTLQQLRSELHGKGPRGRNIFRLHMIKKTDEWAFHYGGRSELQFNIGTSDTGGKMLRYGVAFSFKPSRSLPKEELIDLLRPKVRWFNKFLQLDPDRYSDMRMRHLRDGRWSEKSRPHSIPPQWVSKGVFIFLGRHTSVRELDCDRVLAVMDRLLPLYEYVESKGRIQPGAIA